MLKKILEFIKQKLLLIIIIIVVIVLTIWIISLVKNSSPKGSAYENVTAIMENAARKYYADRPEELPHNGKHVVIKDKKLVELNYMKSINEILKDETSSCTGEVSVENVNGKYRYTPSLDCDDKYKTVSFTSKVKEIPVVTSGDGLYNMKGTLVFRGEYVNNYVTINGKLYRILKIVDKRVYLVSDYKTESIPWDDRYNNDKGYKVGINDYSVSRISEKLNELYESNEIFTDENKLMISTQTLNIGKRKIDEIDSDGSIENSTTIENQYLGLMTVNDFINGSIDENCQKTNDVSCINYNYLANSEYNYWLLTADADTTYRVYRYNYDSGVDLANASSNSYARIVFALTNNTLYVGGEGTKENPYVIK